MGRASPMTTFLGSRKDFTASTRRKAGLAAAPASAWRSSSISSTAIADAWSFARSSAKAPPSPSGFQWRKDNFRNKINSLRRHTPFASQSHNTHDRSLGSRRPTRRHSQGDTAMKSILCAASLAAIAAFALPAEARDQIRIVGSSTVYPFTTAVAEQFGKTSGMKTPVVESTGTGGGMKLFCAGVGEDSPDFTNASRQIKKSEF